ncbi:catalase [Yersinia enterocolitica]|nr:catalase [Yersinia enterocolitica]
MFTRIAGELSQVPEEIQRRQIALFEKVHPNYGAGVKKALGLK